MKPAIEQERKKNFGVSFLSPCFFSETRDTSCPHTWREIFLFLTLFPLFFLPAVGSSSLILGGVCCSKEGGGI